MQDLKRRHWIVIGIVAGVLIGCARVMWPIEPVGRNIKQDQFERLLFAVDPDGGPALADLVVHPRVGEMIVSARVKRDVLGGKLDPRSSGGPMLAVWFLADSPYRPLDRDARGAGAAGTVVDYLDRIYEGAAVSQFQFAWWEQPWTVVGGWTLGTMIVIGGAWPVVLRFLVGAGLGRDAKEPKYDLDRFKHVEPPTKRPQTVVTRQDLAILERIEASIEANLARSADADPQLPEGAEPEQSVPVRLPGNNGIEEPEPKQTDQPHKDFGLKQGDCYPTEIHALPHPKAGQDRGPRSH